MAATREPYGHNAATLLFLSVNQSSTRTPSIFLFLRCAHLPHAILFRHLLPMRCHFPSISPPARFGSKDVGGCRTAFFLWHNSSLLLLWGLWRNEDASNLLTMDGFLCTYNFHCDADF